MRVVSGTAKGRKLLSVPGDGTRPILDRVKTALFDTIRGRIQDAVMLDLFAGSGSVGIEALSQGARHCTFIDLAEEAVKTIRANLETTGLKEKAEVRNTDAFSFIKHSAKSFGFIYIAPPQYKSLWVEAIHAIAERPQIASESCMIIVQIDPSEYEPVKLNDFSETQQRKYGNTLLVFFEKKNGAG